MSERNFELKPWQKKLLGLIETAKREVELRAKS